MLEDPKQFKKFLTQSKLIDKDVLVSLGKDAKKLKKPLKDLIVERNIVSEESLYEAWAKMQDLPYVNLKEQSIRKDILNIIPEPIASTHQVVAFDKDDKEIKLATTDPTDLQTFEFIRRKVDVEIKIHLTSPDSLSEALKQYHKSLQAEFEDIQKKEDKEEESQEKLEELAKDLPVVRIVDTLLEYAMFEGASDIHIEPTEKEVIARYRIDGILRDVMTMPKKIHQGLIARLKILSNLKLDEHRLPQDGRFKVEGKDNKISFRVSIIPIFDGEKVVMRLLNESAQVLTLEQLGFQKTPSK